MKPTNFFEKLTMETHVTGMSGRTITHNIDDAFWVYIPDEETAEQLSEWSKENNYPAFIHCEIGQYYWDENDETFYKEVM